VEDQDSARESLCELLSAEGYQVEQAADGTAGIAFVDKADFDIVLTDLKLPGQDGIAVLKHVREVAPQTFVMIMTAYGSLDSAIEAMRLGAQDYILKPLIIDEVLHKARRLMEHRSLAWEIQMLRTEVSKHFSATQLVGRSPVIQEIMNLIEKVGPAPSTVLITGESGVGKEVVARDSRAEPATEQCLFAR
jgi:DNA-binding NtrC family response regulator